MPWVRVDDALGDDPRVATAGATAVGVLLLALCYSNRNLTGGWVPASIVRRSLEGSSAEAAEEANARLLQSGLLVSAAREGIPGYQIHDDYVRLQPTPAEVLRQRGERSRQKAEAGKLGGINSGKTRRKQKRSTREAESKQPPSISEAPFPIPIPSQKSTGALPPVSQHNDEATHGLLCVLFNEVMNGEDQGSTATDRKEAVKMLCADRKIDWTPESLEKALDAVLTVRRLRGPGTQSPPVASGWTQVSDVRTAVPTRREGGPSVNNRRSRLLGRAVG